MMPMSGIETNTDSMSIFGLVVLEGSEQSLEKKSTIKLSAMPRRLKQEAFNSSGSDWMEI